MSDCAASPSFIVTGNIKLAATAAAAARNVLIIYSQITRPNLLSSLLLPWQSALAIRTKKGIYESFSSYFFHPENKKSKWKLSKELKNFLEQSLVNKYFSKFKMKDFNGEKSKMCFWLIKRKMYYIFMLFNEHLKCRF